MDDAYTAGIIDGEGCIRLASSHRGVVTVTVEVTMSYKALPLLQKMHAAYGGKCLRMKRDLRPTRAVTHSWRLIGRPAVEFLRKVRLYLEIKREHADLAIWLQEKIDATPRGPGRGGPWAQELKDVAARAAARMKELNRTGPARRVPTRGVPMAILEGGEWVSPQMTIDPISDLFTGPWPVSGTVVDGVAYSLPAPTPQELRYLTADSASSSSPGLQLPTPTARDWKGGQMPESEEQLRQARGEGGTSDLCSAAMWLGRTTGDVSLPLFRTPTAQLAVNGGSQHPDKRKAGGHGPTLADEVEHLLPTPRATDGTKGGPNQRGSSGDLMLPSAVMLLPTPTAMDSHSSGGSTPSDVTLTDAVVRTQLGARTNPRFADGSAA